MSPEHYNPFGRAEKLSKLFRERDWFKLMSFVCNTGLDRPVLPVTSSYGEQIIDEKETGSSKEENLKLTLL